MTAQAPARRRGRGPGRATADRMEDFAFMVANGESVEAAARRLDVTTRTAERYAARLRPPSLTPDERAAALGRARAVMFRFVRAVAERDARMVQAVCDGLSREELAALAVVLAAATDPVKLKIVKEEAG